LNIPRDHKASITHALRLPHVTIKVEAKAAKLLSALPSNGYPADTERANYDVLLYKFKI
jgi:hypothetical protein